jgi:hypothetical protein
MEVLEQDPSCKTAIKTPHLFLVQDDIALIDAQFPPYDQVIPYGPPGVGAEQRSRSRIRGPFLESTRITTRSSPSIGRGLSMPYGARFELAQEAIDVYSSLRDQGCGIADGGSGARGRARSTRGSWRAARCWW